MAMDSHPERHEVRLPFSGNILIDGKIMVKGIDISMGGVYVYTGRTLGRGRIVEIDIPDLKFAARARVQHDQPGVGSGLKFMGMTDEQKNRLRLLLQSMDTSTVNYASKTKPEILLVDPNQSARRINKSKMSMEGFFVVEAADGPEALKKLRDRVPDLIVTDLKIDGIDGIKLLTLIRSTPEWSHIPVIMMSTDSSSSIVDRAYEAGVSDLLVKGTTTPAKLAEHVSRIIEKNSR